MIRYLVHSDGSKVLQYFDPNKVGQYGIWVDVPEVDAKIEIVRLQQDRERRELEDKRIAEQLKGKTYTVRR